MRGVRPFRDDPTRQSFLQARLDHPRANHFVVLWAGDRIVASNFGACGCDSVLIGQSTFDPVESRNSPGTLLMLELARLAAEEGFHYIDLTPGGDPYKQVFANASMRLVQPTFRFSTTGRVVADLRRGLRRTATGALKAVTSGEEGFSRARRRLKQVKSALQRVASEPGLPDRVRPLFNRQELLVYRLDRRRAALAPAEPGLEVRIQSYADLLAYTAELRPAQYQQVLHDALRRFARGDVLYSVRHGQEVACWGWRSAPRRKHLLIPGGPTFETDELSVLVCDIVRKDGRRLHLDCLERMLADAADEDGVESIHVCVDADDKACRTAVEARGALVHRVVFDEVLGSRAPVAQ